MKKASIIVILLVIVGEFIFAQSSKQKLIGGTWYLQEVQIPSNEEYLEGVRV